MFNQNELINQLWYLFVIKKKRDKIAHKKLTNTKTRANKKMTIKNEFWIYVHLND